MINTVQPC